MARTPAGSIRYKGHCCHQSTRRWTACYTTGEHRATHGKRRACPARPEALRADSPNPSTDKTVMAGRGLRECAPAPRTRGSRVHTGTAGAPPCSCQVFTMLPTCRELVIVPQHFRVLLLRRAHASAIQPGARVVGPQVRLPSGGCPAGVSCGRGVPLERAAARVCREAGATVSTHTLVRDLNIARVPSDGRRIEVIANGLPLWGGAQLAIDTTLVSALRSAAGPRRYQGRAEGAALRLAWRTKERPCPAVVLALGGGCPQSICWLACAPSPLGFQCRWGVAFVERRVA